MPEDYYGDSNPGPAAPPAEEGQEKESQGEEKTAIIPKALLGGKEFKPGEEVVFKIVRFHDDSVEIAYATGEEEGEPPHDEQAEAKGGNPGGGEMSSMMY